MPIIPEERSTKIENYLAVVACLAVAAFLGVGNAGAVFQTEAVGVRLIQTATIAEAEKLRARIESGASFPDLARAHSLDPTAASGGYLGTVPIEDLRPEYRDALSGVGRGEISPLVPVDGRYVILQLATEAEDAWLGLTDAGRQALREGRVGDAEEHFRAALTATEALGDTGRYLLVESLRNLSALFQVQGADVEARRFYERSMEVAWGMPSSVRDSGVSDVLEAFTDLLALAAFQDEAFRATLDRYTEAIRDASLDERLYSAMSGILNVAELTNEAERTLILAVEDFPDSTGALGADHPAAAAARARRAALGERLVPALLDRFSTIVSLAEFKDNGFREIVSELERLLPLAPLTERSYVQMKDILLEAALGEETETVLRVGLEKFADSRILRIYLSEVLANTGRTGDALGVLREAAALPRPEGLDEPTDRLQQGVIFQRIGDIQMALIDLDAAVRAYERSLDIDPASPEGRIKLGRAYFSTNRVDDALAEYERAARENPDHHEAHLNRAEAHLARGEWGSAAAAAEQAIDLGTTDSRALYLLGTALVRQGRVGDGQERLGEFQGVETGFRDIEHQNREVDATSLAAIGALRAGGGGAAVDYLEEGIALFPDAGRLHMNLAMVQSRLGRRQAAVETYERMLELGVGRRFLIHRNLAEEYAALGDLEASERHRAVYLETREDELIVYAPE